MNHPYLPVLAFFAVALIVPIAALTLARVWMHFFTPIKRGMDKNALYECGVNPLAERQTRFHSQYYLFGLLFLLFDVETVFLLPFAVSFLKLSVGSFLVAMLFLLLLAEGLLWAWSKGLLNWRGPSRLPTAEITVEDSKTPNLPPLPHLPHRNPPLRKSPP